MSGPGVARAILLFHTISARPSKQPRKVGSTPGVYSFGLIFVSARTNKDIIIIMPLRRAPPPGGHSRRSPGDRRVVRSKNWGRAGNREGKN
jgi:hypothetical protein